MIDNGERLGHISDLEIDPDQGRILAIIIYSREKKGGFFGKSEEILVYWEQIVTIGTDVILVKNMEEPKLYGIYK